MGMWCWCVPCRRVRIPFWSRDSAAAAADGSAVYQLLLHHRHDQMKKKMQQLQSLRRTAQPSAPRRQSTLSASIADSCNRRCCTRHERSHLLRHRRLHRHLRRNTWDCSSTWRFLHRCRRSSTWSSPPSLKTHSSHSQPPFHFTSLHFTWRKSNEIDPQISHMQNKKWQEVTQWFKSGGTTTTTTIHARTNEWNE